jgi:hypothetical protein
MAKKSACAHAVSPGRNDASPSDLVFPWPDGSMRSPECDPEKVLRRGLAPAGLVERYEHSCRRCKSCGTPYNRVQRILRHASITTTTDTYGHLTVDDLRDAVARIGPKNPVPFAAGLLQKPPGALPAPKRPQDLPSENRAFQSEPRGDRTHDPRLKRPVLYQLS